MLKLECLITDIIYLYTNYMCLMRLLLGNQLNRKKQHRANMYKVIYLSTHTT